SKKLIHCSNLFYNAPQIILAQKLVELSCGDKVFFCNSGAEANEAAIKLAKRYINKFDNPKKTVIVSMKNSFHGRTLATVALTGQEKYHDGYAPLLEGVIYGIFNDENDLEKILGENVGILIIEPIQGEGGIRPANKSFLQKARDLCDERGIILIFDEVQCGIGRTGKLFAYEQFDVIPDIVSLAKGLGSGFPIGAIVAKKEVAKGFKPGVHASTFGGNPISTTAAKVVLETVMKEGFLENVNETSLKLIEGLEKLQVKYNKIKDVRGMGLILAIEFDEPVGRLVTGALEKGLLIINSGSNVIRFVPALTIGEDEIKELLEILDNLLSTF
ncbi:MAG: acetylornithine/succinylornithine family transaminase, partial [Candidatus Atribacteria bacterium]|nr:acetylornithine/succinylornithine family transaminase [Candidatus Atribacteria bacterium]